MSRKKNDDDEEEDNSPWNNATHHYNNHNHSSHHQRKKQRRMIGSSSNNVLPIENIEEANNSQHKSTKRPRSELDLMEKTMANVGGFNSEQLKKRKK